MYIQAFSMGWIVKKFDIKWMYLTMFYILRFYFVGQSNCFLLIGVYSWLRKYMLEIFSYFTVIIEMQWLINPVIIYTDSN